MGKPENDVEKYLDKRVKEIGGFTRKWISPGHRGVEDRICFFPNGELWFIEVKQEGEYPEDHQWREINRQRELGHNAGYLSGHHDINNFFMCQNHEARKTWMTRYLSISKC